MNSQDQITQNIRRMWLFQTQVSHAINQFDSLLNRIVLRYKAADCDLDLRIVPCSFNLEIIASSIWQFRNVWITERDDPAINFRN